MMRTSNGRGTRALLSRLGHRHAKRECGRLERHVLLLQFRQELTKVFILEFVARVLGLEFVDFILELPIEGISIAEAARLIAWGLTSFTRASRRSLNAFCAARF